MAKELNWSNLLDNNPKEIIVEQYLWSVDVGKISRSYKEDDRSKAELVNIKETLFRSAEYFPKSRGIQSRSYQILQELLNSPVSDKIQLFTELDLRLRCIILPYDSIHLIFFIYFVELM